MGKALHWHPAGLPPRTRLPGNYCCLEPLDPHIHGARLFQQLGGANSAPLWTYMAYGPFENPADFIDWLAGVTAAPQQLFYCITSPAGVPLGQFALSAIDTRNGSIELAHVLFSPTLQRSIVATEAVYLVLQQAFELGFRRCCWKCNALNQASRKAALRFGFSMEGIFRNALVVKGHNRDTAWYGMTDEDWRKLRPAYRQWLQAANFDENGQQRLALSQLTAQHKQGTN